jgi:hypothetical protein
MPELVGVICKMVWLILFIISLSVSAVLIPFRQWKHLYYAGIITMLLIFLIDTILLPLGAYSYSGDYFILCGVPVLYWLSSFPGGALLMHFYPQRAIWRFPYILLTAFLFVLLEYLMYLLGYFHYNHWNVINSFFLDVMGFTCTLWLTQWVRDIKKIRDVS